MNRLAVFLGSLLLALCTMPAQALDLIGKQLQLDGAIAVNLDHLDSDVSRAQADANRHDNLYYNQFKPTGNPTRFNIKGYHPLTSNITLTMDYGAVVIWDGSRDRKYKTRAYNLGVMGPWGQVQIGRIETPFRTLGGRFAVLRTTVAYRNAVLGASSDHGNQMNRRAENAVMWSDRVNLSEGTLNWNIIYSADALKSEGNPDLKNRSMWGFGIERTTNDYTLALAHERWEKIFDARINATRVSLKKKINAVEVGILYENINQDLVAGGHGTLDRDAYGANISLIKGSWEYATQVLMAADYADTPNTGAIMLSVGAVKTVNSALTISFGYTQTRNEKNATFKAIDGIRGDLGTLAGGTPSAFGVDFLYSF